MFAKSRRQKTVSDPVEIELQAAVSCPGCWVLTQVIRENSTHSQLLSRISSSATLDLTGSIWETNAEQQWNPWGPRGNVLGLFLCWNSLPGKIMSPTQDRWKMRIVLQGSFLATVFGWVLLRQGFTL